MPDENDPILADGDPGSIIIPLDHEDVQNILNMPLDKKRELVRNIKQYIRSVGKDYGRDKPATNSTICI